MIVVIYTPAVCIFEADRFFEAITAGYFVFRRWRALLRLRRGVPGCLKKEMVVAN